MATEKPAAPPAPRAIAKLPEAVVNRIAAGEIIQRPSNALKELIENSLDAGATTIRVTVKEGGLKLLQIQDNGSGIRKSDLPILCERFTTSKIKAFEDLSSLGTYGFRGEALASISHIAHLSVTTKTRDETCAWKAAYADGMLIPLKPGGDAASLPCAGNDGTVEDLFYNTPQRLRALRSASEEYARILSVVTAYSIHNAGVAFVCKKMSSTSSGSTADVNTSVGASVLDNIGLLYGDAVRRELVEVVAESKELNAKIKAWCSGANYQAKRSTFLFFINHRYVECSSLKRALEAFYATLLAKGTHPFVYLSLEIDPTKIDVNVHPTKKEVAFEDEDEVVQLVCEKLAEVLEKQGESRSYKVQTLLPTTGTPTAARTLAGSSVTATPAASTSRKPSTSSSTKPIKVAPNKLVRTDAQSQTLDAMFPTMPAPSTSRAGGKTRDADPATNGDEDDRPSKKRKSDHDPAFATQLAAEQAAQKSARVRIEQSECALTSVRQLRKEVVEARHEGLDTLIKGHIFVGVADLDTCKSMIQHQTKLYIVDHAALGEELLYQLGLRQFGRFSRIKLQPPQDLRKVVQLIVDRASRETTAKRSSAEIVERVYSVLHDARAMLDEYFSFSISDDGKIEILLRIGVHVDWEHETPCFETFLRELAYFYSPRPPPNAPATPPSPDQLDAQKRTIKHVLFPAAKQYLVPPEKLLKKDIVLATSLEALFRVFERC
ncbi:DNA mismatch repair protein MLH1 [Rhodotorula toruloides]|uniref:DNA mismatch repair protein MLH1 n=1 Tax=Rhodotorula toruloides TaxID=5286 RepID=A0A511KMT3_RHOTO|nr:DNA mismatch repair protein MLH1 [Rhodotorula toruloides]